MNNEKLGHLSSKETWDFLQEHPNAKLIDIRSSMEFLFFPNDVVSYPMIYHLYY
jgi:hypothetical protein